MIDLIKKLWDKQRRVWRENPCIEEKKRIIQTKKETAAFVMSEMDMIEPDLERRATAMGFYFPERRQS